MLSIGGEPKIGTLTLESMPVLPLTEGIVVNGLRVTRQPGDNFRVVATTSTVWRDDLGAHQPSLTGELRHLDGIELTKDEKDSTSEMLTVWRRLHFEVDSMEAPPLLDAIEDRERFAQRNFIFGRVSAGSGNGRVPTRLWLRPVNSTPPVFMFDGSVDLPDGHGRFENGTICIGATATVPKDDLIGIGCRGPIEIGGLLGNGLDRLRDHVDKPSGFSIPYTLVDSEGGNPRRGNLREWSTDAQHFVLDRPIGIPPKGYEGGTLSVGGMAWTVLKAAGPHVFVLQGHGIPFFLVDDDQAALPIDLVDTDEQGRKRASELLIESDSSSENILAQAYVRPLYDLPSSRVPFRRNLNGLAAARIIIVHRDFSSRPDHWVAYFLVASQGAPAEDDLADEGDGDPNSEFDANDVFVGKTVLAGLGGARFVGSVILLEPLFEWPRLFSVPYQHARDDTVAHELGHQFGLDHGDGGIMTLSVLPPRYLTVQTLGRIRRQERPEP